jgi:hypothetical protein
MTSLHGAEDPSLGLGQRPDAPLGTLIFRAGLVPADQLEDALEEGIKRGRRLGEILIERGLIDEADLARILAGQKGLRFVDLAETHPDPDAVALMAEEKARLYRALAIGFEDGLPLVVITDPTNDVVVREVTSAIGIEPRFAVAARSPLVEAISRAYGGTHDAAAEEPRPAEPPAPAAGEAGPVFAPHLQQSDPEQGERSLRVVRDTSDAAEPAPPSWPPTDLESPPAATRPFTPPEQPEAATPEPAPPFGTFRLPEAGHAPRLETFAKPELEPAAAPLEPAAAPLEPVAEREPAQPPGAFGEPWPPLELQVEPDETPAPAAVEAPAPAGDPTAVSEDAAPAPADALPPTVEDAPAVEPALVVIVRLSNGERVELAAAESEARAVDVARTFIRDLAEQEPSEWPLVGSRFLRPEAIVSLDIVEQ